VKFVVYRLSYKKRLGCLEVETSAAIVLNQIRYIGLWQCTYGSSVRLWFAAAGLLTAITLLGGPFGAWDFHLESKFLSDQRSVWDGRLNLVGRQQLQLLAVSSRQTRTQTQALTLRYHSLWDCSKTEVTERLLNFFFFRKNTNASGALGYIYVLFCSLIYLRYMPKENTASKIVQTKAGNWWVRSTQKLV